MKHRLCHKTDKTIVVSILLIICLIKEDKASHDPEWVTAPTVDDDTNTLHEYSYYDKDVTWNQANYICKEHQAYMLTIDTKEEEDLIQEFKQESWTRLLSKDYWSGLAEPTAGQFIWDNCQTLSAKADYYNPDLFKDESFNKAELCYQIKHNDNILESKKCSDKRYFVCEKDTSAPCFEKDTLTSTELATYENTTLEDCKQNCTTSAWCWSGIFFKSGKCMLLEKRQEGQNDPFDVSVFRKICTTSKFVDTVTVPSGNDGLIPKLNCSGVTVQPEPTTLPAEEMSSTISASPCYETYTINVTYTENVTFTVNYTDTVQVTDTFMITSSYFIAETLTYTMTSSVVDISTAHIPFTSTLVETQTINFTSTILHSSCTATCVTGNKTYAATDDPLLLEAVSSMKKELTVDKKTTSAAVRKRTSAPDDRQSSKVIGMSGVLLISITLGIILCADLSSVLRHCVCIFRRCRNPHPGN